MAGCNTAERWLASSYARGFDTADLMFQLFEKLMPLAVFGTAPVAGVVLIVALLVKDMRPAIIAGFLAALFFGTLGFCFFGADLHSESGWGWTAVGAGLKIGLNTCAGFVFGAGAAAAASRRYRLLSPLLLAIGLLLPTMLLLQPRVMRAEGERRWAEKQEIRRRNPHALVNDSTLPDEEDSGYRVRYVDDEGVVRANSDLTKAAPYVVLPPGRHKLVLHGDTAKAQRLKLEWFLPGEVEVEAGHLYKLRVEKSGIRLIEVPRFDDASR